MSHSYEGTIVSHSYEGTIVSHTVMRGLLSATMLCDHHSLDLAFDADGHKAAALPVLLVDSSDALQQLFADAHLSDPHLSKPKQVGTFPQRHFLLQNNDHDNSTHFCSVVSH